MNYIYAMEHHKPKLAEAILEDIEPYNNSTLDIVLNRPKDYQKEGRIHSEEEARHLDNEITRMLRNQGVKYHEFNSSKEDADKIVELILNILK